MFPVFFRDSDTVVFYCNNRRFIFFVNPDFNRAAGVVISDGIVYQVGDGLLYGELVSFDL